MFTSIVAATDDSDHAQKATELAADLAQKYSAKLMFIHVVNDKQLNPDIRHMAEVEHLLDPVTPAAPPAVDVAGRAAINMQRLQESAAMAYKVLTAVGESIVSRAKRTAQAKGVENVQTVVEGGDPVRCIMQCAEREKADLIVLGNRGLSDLKGLLMGSVSHKVSQLAPCTCITVK